MTPKFRVWLRKEKQMKPVRTIHFYRNGEPDQVDPLDVEEFRNNPYYWSDPVDIEDVILMQSTGLKDCNDREIYEGDVIKVSDGLYEIDEENPFVVVKWDEESGAYTMKDFTGEFDTLNIGWQIADKLVRVEVVGNIYENPELLEEEGEYHAEPEGMEDYTSDHEEEDDSEITGRDWKPDRDEQNFKEGLDSYLTRSDWD